MEEQKYYTPAPEDIRIGMLCEFNTLDAGWETRVLNRYSVLIATNEDNKVRVPYLTAEQIEAEGWERTSDQRDYSFGDRDEEHYTMHHSVAFNEVVINRHSYNEETSSMRKQLVYFGKCRCINDLRLICKLLGI